MLIPLTEAEIERLKKDRADTSHRTDGGYARWVQSHLRSKSAHGGRGSGRSRNLPRHRFWYLHRSWRRGAAIRRSIHPRSAICPAATWKTSAADYHRDFIESIQDLARKNINPLKVMIDGAHDVGMKVHVGIRPAGWSYYQPYNGLWDSPFYLNNPQWRCIDRADRGAPEITRMSWAVPEVRRSHH